MRTFGHFDLVNPFSDLFWPSGILLGTEHFTFKNTSGLSYLGKIVTMVILLSLIQNYALINLKCSKHID